MNSQNLNKNKRTVSFSSPEIEFSEPVHKAISQSGAEVAFWARPKELAKPGTHSGVLTIRDSSSHTQYESVAFEAQIVDYAFDHISRPLLGNMMTFAVGAGSLLTFVLGLMGQIEKTFGLTSGTVGGAIAAFIFTGVFRFYKQRGITITHPE